MASEVSADSHAEVYMKYNSRRNTVPVINMAQGFKKLLSSAHSKDGGSEGIASHISLTSEINNISLKASPSENGCVEKFNTTMNASEKKLPEGLSSVKPKSTSSFSFLSAAKKGGTNEKVSLKGIAKGITGLLKLRKLTMVKPAAPKPKINYENTYKIGPDSGKHLAISKIEQIALDILKTEIGDSTYDSTRAGQQTSHIAEKIKTKVKELDIARYKIVCQVLLTDVSAQGMQTASRCLWEQSTDNYTTATYKNQTICATAMIFGIYLD